MASKLYVDLNGLKEFKDKLTAAYAANSAESFVVNYAKTAGSAEKATKDASGNVITSTYVPVTRTVAGLGLSDNIGAKDLRDAVTLIDGVSFKGSRDTAFADLRIEDKKAVLDLSAYALKEDVTSATAFKGVKATAAELPATGNKAGDIWYVKEESSEYIWVPADSAMGVTAHWEKLGPIVDLSAYKVWEETKSYIDGEITKEVTARNTAISTAIGALDATVGSTSVDSGKHVAVQVVEVDGKLTGLTVSENDIASATALENEVKAGGNRDRAISTAIGALDATVSQTAGADGLALEVVETDGKITSISGSIAANIYDTYGAASAAQTAANGYTDAEIRKLDATVGSTSVATGKHVAVQVVEADGKLTSVTVTENDIASAAALTQEVSDRNAAIKTAIEALDAEKSQAAGADGLALSITEVDGKITAISGSIKAGTYDEAGAASAAEANAKSYADGLIATLNAEDVAGDYVTAVTETDGVISVTKGTKGSCTAGNTGLVDGGTVKTYADGLFNDIGRVTEDQIDGLFA